MDAFEQLQREFNAIYQENDLLKESLRDRALQLEDANWTLLKGVSAWAQNTDGLDLDSLHNLSDKLKELAATNPWHIRGQQLRHSYVFGRGMRVVDVSKRVTNIIERPDNLKTVFSVDGYFRANSACFTSGQYIVFYDVRGKKFKSIPISRISGVITDPDDDSDIWFLRYDQRVDETTTRPVWVPTGDRRRSAERVPTTLNRGEPVLKDVIAYIRRTGHQDGWTWGVPDSLGAMIWTMAYSAYLQGNARLVEALSRFAWTITQKTKGGVNAAAAQVRQPTGGVGETGILTDGSALASVGVPSAQVNMNNGQPLAAAIAASLGVPVIALLSSPGATGGSYGAATTLDGPTIKGFEAIQDSWRTFYQEILYDLGAKEGSVEFPSVETDAVYRQITSVATLVELGVIYRAEARNFALDVLDLVKVSDELPPLPDYPDKSGTIVSGQGVSGSVPGGQTQGDTDHSLDADRVE